MVVTPSAAASPAAPSRRSAAPPATVTALLLARDQHGAADALDGLLSQHRLPERILLLDASLDGALLPPSGGETDVAAETDVADETGESVDGVEESVEAAGETGDDAPTRLRALLDDAHDAGIAVEHRRIPADAGTRRVLPEVIDQLPPEGGSRELIWVLSSRATPEADCLAQLVDAAVPGVGIAAPKLLDAHAPDRFVRFGLQASEQGRLVPDPVCGEVDQGQHDRAGGIDLLAAPLEGSLYDREVFAELGGHRIDLGDLGSDLDLGWRSQRAGRRVIGVPAARMLLEPTATERRPSTEHRRQARRAALAQAPFVLGWLRGIALALLTVLVSLGLLIAKRPGAARTEIAQVPAMLDPRVLGRARSAKGETRVSRADLRSLFVTPAAARRRLVDDLRGVDPGQRRAADARSLETERGGSAGHPLPWLLLVSVLASAWAGRSITESMRHRLDAGLAGGELLGGRATARQLFESWQLGWSGAGWGSGADRSPAVLVLAGLTWVAERLPWVADAQSPAGVVLGIFVVAAVPLAAVVAYVCARTFTDRRWVRAVAALSWAFTGAAAVAVGEGRVGPLLALVLLPRIAAGLARAGRRQARYSDAVRTALWTALLGAVLPLLAALVVVVGVVWLLVGPPGRRARGITLAALPLLLAGPWVLTLREHHAALLGGWGATTTDPAPAPWRAALGEVPGGPALIWATAVLLVVAALCLLAPGRRPRTWAAALVALLGLGWTLGAPFVDLGRRPAGSVDAGLPVTPWSGVGVLLLVGGALVVALEAADLLPRRRTRRGSGMPRRRLGATHLRWVPVAALAISGLASAGVVAAHSYGDDLQTWRELRPLVAVRDAESPLALRTLVVAREDEGLTYRLTGDEPGSLVRGAPVSLPLTPADEQLGDVVASLLGEGGLLTDPPGGVLADSGVGYVVVDGPTAADRRVIDAAPGLTRLGSSDGATTWAVRPDGDDGQGREPSRAWVAGDDGLTPVPTARAHADTDGPVDVPAGSGQLVVAESLDWSDHATVTADGAPLTVDHREPVPTYDLPDGVQQVSIDVGSAHPWWHLLQAVALGLGVYLALPTDRRVPEEDR